MGWSEKNGIGWDVSRKPTEPSEGSGGLVGSVGFFRKGRENIYIHGPIIVQMDYRWSIWPN